MFDLKKPCNDCPFRVSNAVNYGLSPARLDEIMKGPAFECHKTSGLVGEKKAPQQCAGLIALLDSESLHNTITHVAMAFIGYSPRSVDKTDTFNTIDDCIAAHNPKEGQ